MRRTRLVAIALVLTALSACRISIAQQISPATTSDRDPRAMSILKSAIDKAGGGPSLRAIRDFTAFGQMTHFQEDGPMTGTVEIIGRGCDQLRMVSHLPDGDHTMLISHGKGKVSEPNLKLDISPMNAFHLGVSILPILDLIAVSDDPLASVSFEGIEQVGAVSLYKIKFISGIPRNSLQVEGLKNLRGGEVLINTTDFTVVMYRHRYFTGNTFARAIPREIQFSDFRSVGNLLVPFKMSERIGDQTLRIIALQNVEFNLGMTDEKFNVLSVQR
jgi:hypothetical protein